MVSEKPPCWPATQQPCCKNCSRLLPAAPPHNRRRVIIDGSVVARDGICPMFELPIHFKGFTDGRPEQRRHRW